MNRNIIIVLQVVFISTLIIYFFIVLFQYLRPKKDDNLGVEQEAWQHGEKELTIIYKKDFKPAKEHIDGIKANLDRYEAMVMNYIAESGQFKRFKKDGIRLEGFSFPVLENESKEFDFSLDYVDSKDADSFFVAYFKNGKVKNIKTSSKH